MENLLESEVNNANHHSVQAEDKHGTDGNLCYRFVFDAVKRF
jgi:hypothetical protein